MACGTLPSRQPRIRHHVSHSPDAAVTWTERNTPACTLPVSLVSASCQAWFHHAPHTHSTDVYAGLRIDYDSLPGGKFTNASRHGRWKMPRVTLEPTHHSERATTLAVHTTIHAAIHPVIHAVIHPTMIPNHCPGYSLVRITPSGTVTGVEAKSTY